MPGGKFMMYAVVGPTPGISRNTTLPRDAKERCSEFELGVAAFDELVQEEFQPDQRWGLKVSQVFRDARILCAHRQRNAACGNKSTRAARGATWASCPSTTGPLPHHHAGGSTALRPAPSRGAGSAASARVQPGLEGDERRASDGAPASGMPHLGGHWQPYGARGRCRLSAAAGPHCRATRTRAPPPMAPKHPPSSPEHGHPHIWLSNTKVRGQHQARFPSGFSAARRQCGRLLLVCWLWRLPRMRLLSPRFQLSDRQASRAQPSASAKSLALLPSSPHVRLCSRELRSG